MGDLLRFPLRLRLVSTTPGYGELVPWQDGDQWVVDWWAGSGDSVVMLGRFPTEEAAQAFSKDWKLDRERNNTARSLPGTAIEPQMRNFWRYPEHHP